MEFVHQNVSTRLLIRSRLCPRTLQTRATRFLFQRAFLCGSRRARWHAPRRTMIQTLAALLATGDHYARRQVREPDGALRLVNVLAARPARAEGINLALAQQVFIGFRQYD